VVAYNVKDEGENLLTLAKALTFVVICQHLDLGLLTPWQGTFLGKLSTKHFNMLAIILKFEVGFIRLISRIHKLFCKNQPNGQEIKQGMHRERKRHVWT
jgi:hypothetical protein